MDTSDTGWLNSRSPAPGTRRRVVIAALLLYVLLFPAVYPFIDHFYFILGLVPIIGAGLLLGFRGAVYTTLAVSVAHFGILAGPLGTPPMEAFLESLPLVTLLIGGTIGYLRDLRSEVTQQRDELERRNEQLDEFASIVSHDLRNPLNVATGRLELAREDCDSEHLDAVARSHGRMESLIDDVLALAREGETASGAGAVDLSDLAEASWGTVETAEAALVIGTDQVVRADERRLRQLLENVFRNAVEHGGGDLTVTVGDLDDGFYVEDDGPGIPEAEREAVFETGYSTAGTGAGLGLSIVERIAESHGWTVRATGSADGGARFEVTGVESA